MWTQGWWGRPQDVGPCGALVQDILAETGREGEGTEAAVGVTGCSRGGLEERPFPGWPWAPGTTADVSHHGRAHPTRHRSQEREWGLPAALQLPTHCVLGWPGPGAEQQKGAGPSGQATVMAEGRPQESSVSVQVCKDRRLALDGWREGQGTLGTRGATISGMGRRGREASSASNHPRHPPCSTRETGIGCRDVAPRGTCERSCHRPFSAAETDTSGEASYTL